VIKAKLCPTDRNNATDEKLLPVVLFLSVEKACSLFKCFSGVKIFGHQLSLAGDKNSAKLSEANRFFTRRKT
jgi:hypothetical protein